MALSSSLPIYKVAYDLTVHVTQITRNMPRDFRTGIGGRLRDECIVIVLLVFRANAARDKVPHLDALLECLEVAGLLLRLSKDMRLISTAQFSRAIELTGSVGKQANGWRKHSAASPVA